jgi:hypothetical protein
VVPLHRHDDAEDFFILAGTQQILTTAGLAPLVLGFAASFQPGDGSLDEGGGSAVVNGDD